MLMFILLSSSTKMIKSMAESKLANLVVLCVPYVFAFVLTVWPGVY